MKTSKVIKSSIIALNLLTVFFVKASNTYDFKYPTIDSIVTYAANADYLLNAKAINLSNTTVMMAYKLKSSTVPAGWDFTLCDSQKCNFSGAPSREGKSVLSIGGVSQYFKLGVTTTTLLGIIEMEYETWDVSNPSNIQIVKFKLSNLPDEILRWGRTTASLDGNGSSQLISLTSNSTWTISGVPNWLQINSTSGMNNTAIKFTTIENNTTGAVRVAIITVSGPNNRSVLNLTQTTNIATSIYIANGNDKHITISPNPVNQNEVLNFSNVIDVEIFDLIGNSIIKQQNTSKICLEGIRKGIYFLRINNKELKKFVID